MELPKGWELADLGELATYINGKSFKPKEWSIKGLPIIRIQNLNNEKSEFNYCDFPVEDKYHVSNGDLLFAWSGTPNTSFGAHIWNGGRAVLNQHIFKVQIRNEIIIKKFYLHALNNKVKEFVSKSHGTAGLAHITKGKFIEATISIPPLAEQHRIVAKIEELFSRLDKGIESLKTAQAQLKTYRQAVLKWAFEGKLTNAHVKDGELPEGWKWVQLGDMIHSIEAGKSFKCEERPPQRDDTGVLKVSAVTWGIFNEEESKTVLDLEKIKLRNVVKVGDFLFSRANTLELVGAVVKVHAITKKLLLSDKTLRLRFIEIQINDNYALYFLKSQFGRKQIQQNSTGNQESMRNIGQDGIRRINIPLAPLPEQSRIVAEIEKRLSVCDTLEASIAQSLTQAEALRQSILKKAFEGKLVPQDPDDEPASALLERIRAERAAVDAKKPKSARKRKKT